MGSRFISSHFCEGNLSKPESVQVKARYLPGCIKSTSLNLSAREKVGEREHWKARIHSGENNFPFYVTKR